MQVPGPFKDDSKRLFKSSVSRKNGYFVLMTVMISDSKGAIKNDTKKMDPEIVSKKNYKT